MVERTLDVSVVIATRNRAQQLACAVDSALAQKPRVREVIVVDDGSTDGTPELMAAWARDEPRLRYSRLSDNIGIPEYVRNRAAESALGSWLAFLDNDDEWLPGKIEAQAAWLGKEYDVVGGSALSPDGRLYLSAEKIPRFPTLDQILRNNLIVPSSALVRKAACDSARGFSGRRGDVGVEDPAVVANALLRRGARRAAQPADREVRISAHQRIGPSIRAAVAEDSS